MTINPAVARAAPLLLLAVSCAAPPAPAPAPPPPDPVEQCASALLYWAPQDLGEAPDQGFDDYQQRGLSTQQYTELRALVAEAAALGPDRPADFLPARARALCAALGPEPTRGYP
ncbi:hypothetical protein [Pseudonocardia broussonetiae]|uniref:DUF732 domain-containing protein n=1 Tax=Pseudonocardia broussonetiae TaxID=2736640 RepID=A0A6M6JQA5_9PSEU|nr:hypothetical protein [Pseudonocardia broussonetiae]QJY48599.1 hypothetical protein HOP40_24760 [Pseudonocardia broussonetiae]